MMWQGIYGKGKAEFVKMPKEEIHSEGLKAKDLVR